VPYERVRVRLFNATFNNISAIMMSCIGGGNRSINENHEYRYANTHEFTVFFEYVRFIGKTNYIVYFFCHRVQMLRGQLELIHCIYLQTILVWKMTTRNLLLM
jgi:hypothetical protein